VKVEVSSEADSQLLKKSQTTCYVKDQKYYFFHSHDCPNEGLYPLRSQHQKNWKITLSKFLSELC